MKVLWSDASLSISLTFLSLFSECGIMTTQHCHGVNDMKCPAKHLQSCKFSTSELPLCQASQEPISLPAATPGSWLCHNFQKTSMCLHVLSYEESLIILLFLQWNFVRNKMNCVYRMIYTAAKSFTDAMYYYCSTMVFLNLSTLDTWGQVCSCHGWGWGLSCAFQDVHQHSHVRYTPPLSCKQPYMPSDIVKYLLRDESRPISHNF